MVNTTQSSSTAALGNGGNSPSNGDDNSCNQIQPINQDTKQNSLPIQWNELPAQQFAAAATGSDANELYKPTHVNGIPCNPIQSINQNAVPNSVPKQWNESSALQMVPATGSVPNILYNHNNFNGKPYNPPSYMNVPSQEPPTSNGYTTTQACHTRTHVIPHTQNIQVANGLNNQQSFLRYVSHTPTWQTNKACRGEKKRKRVRTAFTSQQVMQLEKEYASTRYLERTRRLQLAEVIGLNERTIKIWFQNRRMKEKKDRAESLEEVSSTQPSPGEDYVPMSIHQTCPSGPNLLHNHVYNSQMPTCSTAMNVPPVSISAMPETPPQVQNIYRVTDYITEEQGHQLQECPAQSQQNSAPCPKQVYMLPSQSVISSSTNEQNEVDDNNWDLSWIKSILIDEE